MTDAGFTPFETDLGWCALAWSPLGITAVHWPTRDRDTARARMARRHPDLVETEPPPAVVEAIEGVRALLRGERPDLAFVAVDLARASDFERQVYAVTRAIPPGQTLTYGEVAVRLGDKLLARDVGQALGHNPVPIIVPCHRVLAAGGKSGGFSAPGGVETKLKVLALEGVFPGGQPSLFG